MNTPETDKSLCRYDHPAWPGGRKFTVNDQPVVLAEFARKLERERDELRAAVRNLRDVKGRHHTEVATLRLFALVDSAK